MPDNDTDIGQRKETSVKVKACPRRLKSNFVENDTKIGTSPSHGEGP